MIYIINYYYIMSKIKNSIIIAVLLSSAIFSCMEPLPPEEPRYDADREFSDTIKIASFNLKNFSDSKIDNPDIKNILIQMLSQFDLVALQEYQDADTSSRDKLIAAISSLGTTYDFIEDPIRYTAYNNERYIYIYKISTIEKVGTIGYTYDTAIGRDPYCVHFKAKNGNFDFVLVNIHTQPALASTEIPLLKTVMTNAAANFSELDVICLGDYNADNPAYYPEADIATDFPAAQYTLIIPNSEDTTSGATNYTYDRFVATNSTMTNYTGTYGVYKYDQVFNLTELTIPKASEISDHYPVWASFNINSDTD